MILVATPSPASADDPEKNEAIPLVNVGSNKCFSPTPQDDHFNWAGGLLDKGPSRKGGGGPWQRGMYPGLSHAHGRTWPCRAHQGQGPGNWIARSPGL
jgi:hypothetical protein